MVVSDVPELRVFKRGQETKIINWLMDRGFSPSYDGLNITTTWVGEHRFYKHIDGVFVQDSDGDLLIGFNEGIIVTKDQWDDVLEWLNVVQGECYDRADLLLKRMTIEKPMQGELPSSEPLQQPPVETEYGFYCEPFMDGFLYEVAKPNTDRRYTVFEDKWVDHINFFSALFVCDSWGVSTNDLSFLHGIWKSLNMPGCLDLEGLVQKRVEECRLGAPEPRVFRRSLLEVKGLLTERAQVTGQKRKGVTDEVDRKK